MNNIRVLAFSSSTYLGLMTILVLLFDRLPNYTLVLLLPLPIVWIRAWSTNSKRAIQFHVPRACISDLLISNRYRVRIIGAIAALHVSSMQVSPIEVARILHYLSQSLVDVKEKSIVKVYVARTLWHFRFREFSTIGQVLQDKTHTPGVQLLTSELWKDTSMPQSPGRRRSSIRPASGSKFATYPVAPPCKKSQILPATTPKPRRQSIRNSISDATASIKKMAKRMVTNKITTVVFEGLHDPLRGTKVVSANQTLVDTMLEILYSDTEEEGKTQAAKFLLDLFRVDHILLTPETYVLMNGYLCSFSEDADVLRSAVSNLHRYLTDVDLPGRFWNQNHMVIKSISSALASPSSKTVHECATVLHRIIKVLCRLKVEILLPSQFLRNVF